MRRQMLKPQIMLEGATAGGDDGVAAPHHQHDIVVIQWRQTMRFRRARTVVDNQIDLTRLQGLEYVEGRIDGTKPDPQRRSSAGNGRDDARDDGHGETTGAGDREDPPRLRRHESRPRRGDAVQPLQDIGHSLLHGAASLGQHEAGTAARQRRIGKRDPETLEHAAHGRLEHVQPHRNPRDAAIGQQVPKHHQVRDVEGLEIGDAHRETRHVMTNRDIRLRKRRATRLRLEGECAERVARRRRDPGVAPQQKGRPSAPRDSIGGAVARSATRPW